LNENSFIKKTDFIAIVFIFKTLC